MEYFKRLQDFEGGHEVMQLGVVCRDIAGQEVTRDLRHWQDSDDWAAKRLIDEVVVRFDCLRKAADWRAEDWPNRLLLAVGLNSHDLEQLLFKGEQGPLATSQVELPGNGTILFAGGKGGSMAPRFIPCDARPLDAVRETLLREHLAPVVRTRVLSRLDDLVAYFRLRYKIWGGSGYIPPDRNPKLSRLEIEYSDRTAIPLGAFDRHGGLVGCARLVRNFGKERHRYVKLIGKIVAAADDPVLWQNFERPNLPLSQPFDLLEHFPDFRNYYQALVCSSRESGGSVAVGEVSRVIVDADHRGRRIGELLVYDLISLARGEGITKLLLACREELMPMYDNCGFRQVDGIRSVSFGDIPVTSFVMELDI